jgi:hypothetical protein
MEWDKELSTKDGRMTARTSTLTDELALVHTANTPPHPPHTNRTPRVFILILIARVRVQVKYVFCDKTGTLTENVMKFKQCSIRGRLYEDAEEDHLQHALVRVVGRVCRVCVVSFHACRV